MDAKTSDNIGRYVSYLLRHAPESASLDIDGCGYVCSDALVDAVQRNFPDIPFTMDSLIELVENNNKRRYSFSLDGRKIRANQGHSFPVDLGLRPVTPPDVLYHGTATRFVDSIMQEGLKPQTRTHVHLSGDVETAVHVGERHGKPCVLVVDARRMHGCGYDFFLSENGVWLVGEVPAEFLSVLEDA